MQMTMPQASASLNGFEKIWHLRLLEPNTLTLCLPRRFLMFRLLVGYTYSDLETKTAQPGS